METNLIGTITVLILTGLTSVSCHSSYYSYQTNSVDDGNRVVTNVATKHYDSRRSLGPELDRKIFVEPSKSRMIHDHQVATNNIGLGLENEALFHRPVFMQPINGRYRTRGFLTNARAVDLPTFVGDIPSGRAGTVSVANELAKMLHIKQGHYSDIYNKIDHLDQPTGTTKRPADAVEDAVRAAVVRLYKERNRNQKDHPEKNK